MDEESVENGDSVQVYADSCLVCNEQCYLRPINTNTALDIKEKLRIREIREVIYKAFDINVGQSFILENNTEIPLCPPCTYLCGQLKMVQEQIEGMEKNYHKIKEKFAYKIIDLMVKNGSVGPHKNFELRSQSASSLLNSMKISEIESIQHLIYESWQPHFLKLRDEEKNKKMTRLNTSSLQGMHGIKILQVSSLGKIDGNFQAPRNAIILRPKDLEMLNEGRKISSPEMEKSNIVIRQVEGSEENPIGHFSGNGTPNFVMGYAPPAAIPSTSKTISPPVIDEEAGDLEPETMTITPELGDPSDLVEDKEDISDDNVEYREWDESNGQFPQITDEGFSQDQIEQITIVNNDNSDSFNIGGVPIKRISVDMDQSTNSNDIEMHQDTDGLYVCMFCDARYIHKYPYRDHLKTHTGEGPKCKICHKIFPKTHNLMLHMRTHTGEKPYDCEICRKRFADKSNLKVHLRTHTGEKPYICEFCNQSFVNSSRLVIHRRLHTGEKPYKCRFCSKSFNTSNQLNAHERVHKELANIPKPFPCTECDKSYSSHNSLSLHMTTLHPNAAFIS